MAYTVKKITSISGIEQIIFPYIYDSKTERYRSSVFYRGLSNSDYKLGTSLYRNCGHCDLKLEKSIIRSFAKYSASESSAIQKSIWEKLFIGQHHGLPTRILDWTWSPLIGLHFATGAENLGELGKNHVALWAVDFNDVHNTLPDKYKNSLTKNDAYIFTIEMLNDLADSLEAYDNDMDNDKSMVLVEPPSIDPRIINQYSFFSIFPHNIIFFEDFLNAHSNKVNAVKYIINKKIVWQLRDYLDMMNISERTVYPGLDGISKWLKRYYFVPEKKR